MAIDLKSLFVTLIPVMGCILVFMYVNKKKQSDKNQIDKKKDDLWHIIKEYVKKTGRIGYEILDWTIFPRPSKKELNKLIHECNVAKTKHLAKFKKTKYRRPKRQSVYESEDYFAKLEEDTKAIQEQLSGHSGPNKRNRYVINFQAKANRSAKPLPWESIEIELFKDDESKSDSLYSVAFNKKLIYQKELSWMYNMQRKYFVEKLEKTKKNTDVRDEVLRALSEQ